jgi:polyhydroxyalkanoate synthase
MAGDLEERAAEGLGGPNPFVGLRADEMTEALAAVGAAMLRDPSILAGAQLTAWRGLMSTAARAPDRRFADAAWSEVPGWAALRRAYEAWAGAVAGLADRAPLAADARERARFVLGLMADAAAPTNLLAGNPAALRRAAETGGASLVAGFRAWLRDLGDNGGMPAQVDREGFAVGGTVAATPGAVVFRNAVLELIQYRPVTAEVQARPHLFVPPQINRFYIFDLAPGRSQVEHLVSQGFQVFMVSWRNPTAAERDWDLGTYVAALREAGEAVREITGSPDLILHAACSGAMTAMVLAAVLAAEGDGLIHAMTLMVAVLGTGPEAQLGVFASPRAIAAAKRAVGRKGVLEGSEMGRVFAWMRPNDLVWSYWVNNYLMGEPPPRFDLLYWNSDTTRLPARFHGQMLDVLSRGMLLTPGAVTVNGTAVDLGAIRAEKFILAGRTDHITPWKGVHGLTRAVGGANEFVLSSGGHVQSLVSPPGKGYYHLNPDAAATPEAWVAGARKAEGSWWGHWTGWLAARSGERRPAPARLGSDRHVPDAAAPGSYVHE